MHPIPFSAGGGGGGEPPTKFSRGGGGGGGLTGPQLLEGVAGKEWGDFFQGEWGGAIFTSKAN